MERLTEPDRMNKQEVINQLKDLIRDREALLDPEEPDSVFAEDIEALQAAIEMLEVGKENE